MADNFLIQEPNGEWREIRAIDVGGGVLVPVTSGGGSGSLITGDWSGNKAFSSADAAVAANTLYAAPWTCEQTGLYDQMAIRITAGVAGNAKLGVYSVDPTTRIGLPLAEIDTDISTAATGVFFGTLITPLLGVAGTTYWLCAVFDATPSVRGYNPGSIQGGGFGWQSGAGAGAKWSDTSGNYVRMTAAVTYVIGAPFFPASVGAVTFGAGAPGAPILAIRKA